MIIGLVLGLWGVLMRCWLHPLACRLAALALAQSPLAQRHAKADLPRAQASPKAQRQLLLLLVAYHPSALEVEQLQACLAELPPEVGYAVVVNDHMPGEPVEQRVRCRPVPCQCRQPWLQPCREQVGGAAGAVAALIGVLNTDLHEAGTFQHLLMVAQHPNVNLAVPQILELGAPQKLCKHHPTVLGMFSRRFLPNGLKPAWLKRYDRWYVMADKNYQRCSAPYLSGCCMLMRSRLYPRWRF